MYGKRERSQSFSNQATAAKRFHSEPESSGMDMCNGEGGDMDMDMENNGNNNHNVHGFHSMPPSPPLCQSPAPTHHLHVVDSNLSTSAQAAQEVQGPRNQSPQLIPTGGGSGTMNTNINHHQHHQHDARPVSILMATMQYADKNPWDALPPRRFRRHWE
jgi:hypothetical protein